MTAAINDERRPVVSDEPYGDGLVIVVKDDLQAELWLDKEWLGDVTLARLDQFVQLRRYLDEVDDVAVLTEMQATDLREELAANA